MLAALVLLPACGGGSADDGAVAAPDVTAQQPVSTQIEAQPRDQQVAAGEPAAFEVRTEGGGAADVQWQVSSDGQQWDDVEGATAPRLELPAAVAADSGRRYRALVSSEAGSAVSEPAQLRVQALAVAPTIIADPRDASVNVGQDATFGVAVSQSTTSPKYKWQTRLPGKSWSTLADSNSPEYVFENAKASDDGRQFRVVVSNSEGQQTSAVAELKVVETVAKPVITNQPDSQTAIQGEDLTLRVTASGSSLRYQWQWNPPGPEGWRDVGGAKSRTLKLNNRKLSHDGRRYRVIVSNPGGKVTSAAARITVLAMEPPKLGDPPKAGLYMVGQSLQLKANATGKELKYRWRFRRDGTDDWKDLPGATKSRLTIAPVRITDAGAYRAVVSNAGGQKTSPSTKLAVVWGEAGPSADTSSLQATYDVNEAGGGGGDSGGTAGGADGGGADGGVGYGKALNARMTITRVADGALVGSALTHPETGLIKIKAGPGTAPVLLTVQGTTATGTQASVYYDEGLAALDRSALALAPLGPDVTLHALVTSFRENLGVTPLTEAAYRYAINQFLVDPKRVASGAEPLRSTATAGELSRLSAEQIDTANRRILAEVKRHLPELTSGLSGAEAVDSLTALPTPLDSTGPDVPMLNNRYGRGALITGGLVTDAFGYNQRSRTPGLAIAEQLARDLTDGRIDGFALDGSAAAAPAAQHYKAERFGVALMAGANVIAGRFADASLRSKIPEITEATISRGSVNNCDSQEFYFEESFLRAEGGVSRFRTIYHNKEGCGPPSRIEPRAEVDDSERVRQVTANSGATFFVKTDGTVLAYGFNDYGLIGPLGEVPGFVDVPRRIAGLSQVSTVAATRCNAIARLGNGTVYSWGRDCDGSLGRNLSLAGRGPCTTQTDDRDIKYLSCPTPGRVALDVPAVAIAATTSETINDELDFDSKQVTSTMFAIDADGAVYAWGSGQFGLRGTGLTKAATAPSNKPTRIPNLDGVVSMSFTPTLAFAVRRDGSVYAWGTNRDNEFGDGKGGRKAAPALVTALKGKFVKQISVGNSGIFALLADGSLLRWGFLRPRGVPGAEFEPVPKVPAEFGGAKVRHIAGAGYFILTDGRVMKYNVSGGELFDAGVCFFGNGGGVCPPRN